MEPNHEPNPIHPILECAGRRPALVNSRAAKAVGHPGVHNCQRPKMADDMVRLTRASWLAQRGRDPAIPLRSLLSSGKRVLFENEGSGQIIRFFYR